jgi:ABC-type transport system involved in cytochrome c biogenesis permease component
MYENKLVNWASGLAIFVGIMDLLGAAVFIIAYIHGGADATSDNWVGMFTAIALLGGLAISFLAFILALFAHRQTEEWTGLLLPILLFPVTLSFIAGGEFFWWE